MESTEWDAKEHFTFIFENIQDMETFMIICRDTLNLRVNAGRAQCIWVTVHPTHCLLVCLRVSDNFFFSNFLLKILWFTNTSHVTSVCTLFQVISIVSLKYSITFPQTCL